MQLAFHRVDAAHALKAVDDLGSCDQHLLWITTAQRAGSPEGQVINNGYRPVRLAATHGGDCGGGAGADDDQVVSFHVYRSLIEGETSFHQTRKPGCLQMVCIQALSCLQTLEVCCNRSSRSASMPLCCFREGSSAKIAVMCAVEDPVTL